MPSHLQHFHKARAARTLGKGGFLFSPGANHQGWSRFGYQRPAVWAPSCQGGFLELQIPILSGDLSCMGRQRQLCHPFLLPCHMDPSGVLFPCPKAAPTKGLKNSSKSSLGQIPVWCVPHPSCEEPCWKGEDSCCCYFYSLNTLAQGPFILGTVQTNSFTSPSLGGSPNRRG